MTAKKPERTGPKGDKMMATEAPGDRVNDPRHGTKGVNNRAHE